MTTYFQFKSVCDQKERQKHRIFSLINKQKKPSFLLVFTCLDHDP